MKDLFVNWDRVSRQLTKADHWLLLFDLDGTLAAITSTPERTVLAASVRNDLQRLAARSDCLVGVISGRSIEQVRRLLRLPALTYVGNHGLEIQNRGWSFQHPKATALVPTLRQLERRLRMDLKNIAGAIVENKKLTLSVHYRLVSRRQISSLIRRVRRQWKTLPKAGSLNLRRGKKVLEICPALHWNKGSAVIWLKHFAPPKAVILYAGDDETDEDAFKVLGPNDISVRVGHRRSSRARYGLRRQSDLPALLKRLIALPRRNLHG